MSAPTAVVTDVTKSYGSRQALQPTSLRLEPGVVGLLGPNGAGKSTLVRLLASAMPPTSGRIVVDGHEVTGSIAERTAARRVIGYLPQEVRFPRGMTAFAFVDYIAVLKEWAEGTARHREVDRVLDLVGLGDRRTWPIRKLSGGQRRRLALAQALVGDPRLIVLDEPTTGLDPQQRASLRDVLSGLAQRGTVFLATHQTEDVAALCDRVILLVDGCVLFDGRVAEFVATAEGHVWVGASAAPDSHASWRTGTGSVRSVGGRPGADAAPVPATVEDAYLLMTGPSRTPREGAAR
ncbi:MAG: ATP-binding cassette domain-containing protein [Candidatus Nanopelagicales bacterium]